MTESKRPAKKAAPKPRPAVRKRPARKAAPKPVEPVMAQAEEVLDQSLLEVFDLDAAIAESISEQEESEFYFDFGGEEWTFRPASQTDAKLLVEADLSEMQQVMVYIRDLLGEEQWERFPRITFAGALLLIEQYSEFTNGVTLGEVGRSTDS